MASSRQVASHPLLSAFLAAVLHAAGGSFGVSGTCCVGGAAAAGLVRSEHGDEGLEQCVQDVTSLSSLRAGTAPRATLGIQLSALVTPDLAASGSEPRDLVVADPRPQSASDMGPRVEGAARIAAAEAHLIAIAEPSASAVSHGIVRSELLAGTAPDSVTRTQKSRRHLEGVLPPWLRSSAQPELSIASAEQAGSSPHASESGAAAVAASSHQPHEIHQASPEAVSPAVTVPPASASAAEQGLAVVTRAATSSRGVVEGVQAMPIDVFGQRSSTQGACIGDFEPGCMLNAQCCSGRCTSAHQCGPGFR
mmetsp:Transcript_142194/g.370500  ORF Transcript_142194/g.370500 Transcript_142194/m.370500 type:complete len:308 (-) Transcript_142194:71-994(-)